MIDGYIQNNITGFVFGNCRHIFGTHQEKETDNQQDQGSKSGIFYMSNHFSPRYCFMGL